MYGGEGGGGGRGVGKGDREAGVGVGVGVQAVQWASRAAFFREVRLAKYGLSGRSRCGVRRLGLGEVGWVVNPFLPCPS